MLLCVDGPEYFSFLAYSSGFSQHLHYITGTKPLCVLGGGTLRKKYLIIIFLEKSKQLSTWQRDAQIFC